MKEALYGGKLKNQPGSEIRKGDDLSTKMDTVRKTSTNDSGITKATVPTTDSSIKRGIMPIDSVAFFGVENKNDISGTTTPAAPAATASKDNAATLKDNNLAWKGYIDSVISILKAEVLPSKKN